MKSWDDALTELVIHRGENLLTYGRLLTGSADTAQDLLHDALVKVCAKRVGSAGRAVRGKDDDRAARLEGYVRSAMTTIYIDQYRRIKLWSRVLRLSSRPEVPTGHEEGYVVQDEFSHALAQLSPRERACVILRHYEGLSTKETAAALKLSEGSVKRYLSDAMGVLRDVLRPDTSNTARSTQQGASR